MLDRRRFLRGMSVSLFAAPRTAGAQSAGKMYRIGHIFTGSRPPDWSVFVQALSGLGWVEGKNFVFEHRDFSATSHRFADANLRAIAEELVRINVDVIVLRGGHRARVIENVSNLTPIVTLGAGELVASGIVQSLARPGGNITGVQNYAPELQSKRLQILKELVPTLSRVAVIRRGAWHPAMVAAYREATDSAANALGLSVHYVQFLGPDELPGAFSGMVKQRCAALIIWEDPTITLYRRQVLDLAVRHRLPTIAEYAAWPEAGALAAYGARQDDLLRQAATYVDRILKGAKPGDLPIGQPTTFALILNLKAAKSLRLIIPPSVLARADQVIE
jgi:ABC-type uncharacterized transport system substrate-binding protein